MIMVCKKLRLDPVVAVAAMYIPSSTGTVSSPIEPFNTLVGQEIAGLPQMSGALVRLIMWIIFVGVAIWYIVHYASKISRDPSRSIVGCYTDDDDEGRQRGLRNRQYCREIHCPGAWAVCLIVLLAVFATYAFGTIKYGVGASLIWAPA